MLPFDDDMIFDRCGNAITMGRWVDLKRDESYWRLGHDFIGPVEVSTIWLGMSGWGEARGIFETAIFAPAGSDVCRYDTNAEAYRGHSEVVTALRAVYEFFNPPVRLLGPGRPGIARRSDGGMGTP